MSYLESPDSLPAPCIVDSGTLVNKEDMQRLLGDLAHVRYMHQLDGKLQGIGEAYVAEVFSDPQQATLVANGVIHLNVYSFDCLRLYQDSEGQPYFDLVQDNRQLRLIPLSDPLSDRQVASDLAPGDLEAMVAQVLSAKCDVQFDDEDDGPF
ncbi:MAG: hypothetical protein AAFY11_05900 [Cyanobacteria bacterium J06641_5]